MIEAVKWCREHAASQGPAKALLLWTIAWDLKPGEYEIRRTITDMANAVGVHRGTLHRLINELHRDGLLHVFSGISRTEPSVWVWPTGQVSQKVTVSQNVTGVVANSDTSRAHNARARVQDTNL